mgnify:CR=1 FL=1|jgi:hypothetical protein
MWSVAILLMYDNFLVKTLRRIIYKKRMFTFFQNVSPGGRNFSPLNMTDLVL